MKITVEDEGGKYPSFRVNIASKEGAEPFLTIKGCKMIDGQKGRFISFPAKKNEKTDKWYAHVWASDKFQDAIKDAYDDAMPKPAARVEQKNIDDDSVPF